MSIADYCKTISYSEATDFNYGSGVTFDSGIKLALEALTGQTANEDFVDGTGFTWDSTKAQFAAGEVEQIDKRPTEATFCDTFVNATEASWGNAILTRTLAGAAVVSGGELDLTQGGAGRINYADYDGTGNVSTQTATIDIEIEPQYTGNPAVNQDIYLEVDSVTGNNSLSLLQLNNGTLFLIINDLTGVGVVLVSFGVVSFVAGTKYTLSLNVDLNAGEHRLFIDGVQQGATGTGTGTRNTDVDLIRFGGQVNIDQNFKVNRFVRYSTVQHTTDYTVDWSNIFDTIYLESEVELPAFSYPGPGTVQAATNFVTTESGAPRYTLDGQYWNGSAWAASSATPATANTKADILANLATFTPSSGVPVVRIYFGDTNTQSSVGDLTLTYSGQIYPTTDPTFRLATDLTADQLESITFGETITGSDLIRYIIEKDGNLLYWDSAAWTASDGTYAQSNVSADVVTNLKALNDSNENVYDIIGFLHSNDGSSTPILTSIVVDCYLNVDFVVEDGTGKADATSYATVQQFFDYWYNKGTNYSTTTETQIKQWLNAATQYIDSNYTFKSQPTSRTQALSWPRYAVEDRYGYYYDNDDIPSELIKATCEIAAAVSKGLYGDGQTLTSLSYGPVSKSFSGGSAYKKFPEVDRLLKYLAIQGNTMQRVN